VRVIWTDYETPFLRRERGFVFLRIIIKILYLSDLCSEMEGRHYENDAFMKKTESLFEDCLKGKKVVYRC